MSTWGWIGIGLGVLFILAAVFASALCAIAGRKLPAEQAREDEEQIAYIREWRDRKEARQQARQARRKA